MRIVVLDGYTLNPGDLSWDPLAAMGPCTVHDRTPAAQVVSRAAGAGIVLTNKTPIGKDTISQLSDLRYIGVLATGYNIVDIAAARRSDIPVTNVPGYATTSVAQLVFAHLLNLAHHVGHHAETVQRGRWSASEDFCYWDFPLLDLSGMTMGIIGFGRIGQATARIASAFGMRVIAAEKGDRPVLPGLPVEYGTTDELFQRSDVISLHCPLTEETRELVNRERLMMMKTTAFLINTGRGQLVDESALAEALNQGRIAGAGLDVLAVEPPLPDNPLLRAKNCFITPHIAWATRAARERLLRAVVDNIAAYLRGSPQNVVNP
jgi:glycerate dehydrogenase